MTLVVGLAERHPSIRSTLWNTGVVIGPDGRYLGKHRKLVAVMHERLYFNRGGREDIRTFETPRGQHRRLHLLREPASRSSAARSGRLGEEIHCALWTGPTPRVDGGGSACPSSSIASSASTHALDTGTFVAISSQMTDARARGRRGDGSRWAHSGGSYIIDPLGRTLASVPRLGGGHRGRRLRPVAHRGGPPGLECVLRRHARRPLRSGPVGDPVSALAPPSAAFVAGRRASPRLRPLALPSAEGAYEGPAMAMTASRPPRSAPPRSRTAASGSTAVASTAKACELIARRAAAARTSSRCPRASSPASRTGCSRRRWPRAPGSTAGCTTRRSRSRPDDHGAGRRRGRGRRHRCGRGSPSATRAGSARSTTPTSCSARGLLLGKHRKLVPDLGRARGWTGGDGSTPRRPSTPRRAGWAR